METDSFEAGLRQALARCAAEVPDEAVERLQHRDYRPRTRRRGTVAAGSAVALAAVAAVTVTVLPAGSHPAVPAALGKSPAVPVQLTARQTLLSLSVAAAAATQPSGRYAVQTEKTDTTDVYPAGMMVPRIVPGSGLKLTRLKHKMVLTLIGKETTVIDTSNGSTVTYQQTTSSSGSAPTPGWKSPTKSPTKSSSGPGTAQTSAQLDALPTNPAKLRAELLKAGDEQGRIPHATDADVVYEQAAALLWDANLSAAVRSALYKVLAATPGVTVNANATDSSGRTAVEITYFEAAASQEIETFENPATGATLESAWVGPSGDYAEDLYESTTYTKDIPASPYQG